MTYATAIVSGAAVPQGLIASSANGNPPSPDPAIAAVLDWVSASEAEHNYMTPNGLDWDDDPEAVALTNAATEAYSSMSKTTPTTLDGFALMVRAHWYDVARNCKGNLSFWNDDDWPWSLMTGWADMREKTLFKTMVNAGCDRATA